jgi:hypothetical protein
MLYQPRAPLNPRGPLLATFLGSSKAYSGRLLRRIMYWSAPKIWIDSSGKKVIFAEFRSKDREVASWTQPLVFIPGIRVISVDFFLNEGRVSKVCLPNDALQETSPKTEVSDQILTCSSHDNLGQCPSVEFSASGEGGRFLWHDIRIRATIHNHQLHPNCAHSLSAERFVDTLRSELSSAVSFRLAGFAAWVLSE